ncbi:GDSL esterase/lipase [Trifolium repens]|nr:GDSL esterase/lipase [Trifolium repens]
MANFLVFISYIVVTLSSSNGFINGVDAARAFFVFGDSLVDNGNNNYLATTARADSPPYGIDFPTREPTGRFSNGLNIPDLISQEIGTEPILPYLSPELKGDKLLVGANFASAGVGILNDTGFQFIEIIRMSKQLDFFKEYKERVSDLIGEEESKRLINGALVLITCGGNDFVNNYYLVPKSLRSRQYSLPNYVKYLISEYKKILWKLYHLGARKLYNPQLVKMIKRLNKDIGDHVFIAANAHKMQIDFITNPELFGFVSSKEACCGQGPYNGIGLCTPLSNLCQNRDLYVFWDQFHPSEKANRIIVKQILTGSNEYMHPINLSTVLAMDSFGV